MLFYFLIFILIVSFALSLAFCAFHPDFRGRSFSVFRISFVYSPDRHSGPVDRTEPMYSIDVVTRLSLQTYHRFVRKDPLIQQQNHQR